MSLPDPAVRDGTLATQSGRRCLSRRRGVVLVSFVFVNLSLAWLGARGRTRGGAAARTADVVVPALGVLLCGSLLVEGGWAWIAAAAGVGVIGVALRAVTRATICRIGPTGSSHS